MKSLLFFPLFVVTPVQAWTPCQGDWVSYAVSTQQNTKIENKTIEVLFKAVNPKTNEVIQETTEISPEGDKKITVATLDLRNIQRENTTVQGSLRMLCRPTSFETIQTLAGIFKACPLGKEELKTWYTTEVTFNLVKEQQILADKTKIITTLQEFKKICP